MKLGIFGDSFAADNKMNPTDSWIDILRNTYEVENHALSGTNLYYSVSKLKEHYTKYEKIIFVVTQPSRIKIADHVPCYSPEKRYVATYPNIEFLIKEANNNNIYNGPLINAYKAAEDYYKYIQDDVYDNYIHKLMLDDIIKTCPDIVLVPVFKNSIPSIHDYGLADIRAIENTAWQYGFFIPLEFNDERNCHLTKENNLILAEKMKEWLQGITVKINLKDFATPMNKEFYLKNE